MLGLIKWEIGWNETKTKMSSKTHQMALKCNEYWRSLLLNYIRSQVYKCFVEAQCYPTIPLFSFAKYSSMFSFHVLCKLPKMGLHSLKFIIIWKYHKYKLWYTQSIKCSSRSYLKHVLNIASWSLQVHFIPGPDFKGLTSRAVQW